MRDSIKGESTGSPVEDVGPPLHAVGPGEAGAILPKLENFGGNVVHYILDIHTTLHPEKMATLFLLLLSAASKRPHLQPAKPC
jgi:hypothetical protein